MSQKSGDPEFEALQAVHAALKPLQADARTRVLASLYALLGIGTSDATLRPSGAAGLQPDRSENMATAEVQARPSTRPLSINELAKDKSPATNAQWFALFAYYRDRHESMSRFSRDDLRKYFPKVYQQPPRNYDRDFVGAVKKGWIHEDGDESYITSKGIEAVESGFAGEREYARRAGRPRNVGRSTRSVKSTGKPEPKVRRKRQGGI